MPTSVSNWLLRSGAGGLLNLQRTPMVAGTDSISANPKKAQGNNIYSHTRQLLPGWPENAVVKIKGTTGISMNALELETTISKKTIGFFTPEYAPNDNGDVICPAIISIAVSNTLTGGGTFPVIWPYFFGGSDYTIYDSADFVYNDKYYADLDGDGIDETYYDIYEASVTLTGPDANNDYDWSVSGSVTSAATSPVSLTNSITIDPSSSYYGNGATASMSITGSAVTMGDVGPACSFGTPYSGSAFCARHEDDSAHGLALYVEKVGYTPAVKQPLGATTDFGHIGSYRYATTDSPAQAGFEWDCTCKFFYTPDACDDCWYEGKTVEILISYKQIAFTETGLGEEPGGMIKRFVTMGSPSAHSTVTKTLTLPGGHTRQEVGTSFTVPTLAGHAVVIDDIKLVSVT